MTKGYSLRDKFHQSYLTGLLVEIYDFTYTLTESIPLHQEITDADVNVDVPPIVHELEALSDVVWLQK